MTELQLLFDYFNDNRGAGVEPHNIVGAFTPQITDFQPEGYHG